MKMPEMHSEMRCGQRPQRRPGKQTPTRYLSSAKTPGRWTGATIQRAWDSKSQIFWKQNSASMLRRQTGRDFRRRRQDGFAPCRCRHNSRRTALPQQPYPAPKSRADVERLVAVTICRNRDADHGRALSRQEDGENGAPCIGERLPSATFWRGPTTSMPPRLEYGAV
jgi:hypothetical protein